VLNIFRMIIIHVKNFSQAAVIEAIFKNESDLAVLTVLSLTRQPSFFGKTRAAAGSPWL